MTEAPIDLSRPSPPPLIPIVRFKGGLPSRRDVHKDVSNREVVTDTQARSDLDHFPGRASSWSFDIQARLGVPTVTTVQTNKKVLRVCVNNNSIPPSSEALSPGSRMAATFPGDTDTSFTESSAKWSWLANLSRSHSVPNVAQSSVSVEVCPRRKAMSEERVTEGSEEGYDKPRKRRRHYESLDYSGDGGGSEQAWKGQFSRKSMTGSHVRSGTGAAPATLKGLRDKILRRRISTAADVR